MSLVEEVAELVRLRNNGPSCEDIAERILRLVAERQREPSEGMVQSVPKHTSRVDIYGAVVKDWAAMHAAFWNNEGIEP